MELNWSLKELYSSFESEEFKNDIEKIKILINDMNNWVTANTVDYTDVKNKLETILTFWKDIVTMEYILGNYIQLNVSTNTKNAEALKYSDIFDNIVTDMVGGNTKAEEWISKIDNVDEVIESSELLKEHSFMIKEIISKSKYALSEKEENLVAKMQNTGSTAWGKLKDNLISGLMVDIEVDGVMTKEPLTKVLNMAYEVDADIRKKAYYAEIESYKSVEEGVCAALNAIKGEVITVTELRGYKSPLDQTLKASRMSEETLNSMLEAMKESLPVFRKYLKRKGELLGHKNGLPWYDLYAPVTNADMSFNYEKGSDFVIKNFYTFSKHLGDFAKRAVENSWIDVMPKEGKVGGAFCAGLHPLGESRVLLNYGEAFGDVVTMAHELGHGFHGECLKNESILNADYPMPIAETASTFCETIVTKAAIKEASKEEALAILESSIGDATQVIVDIYSRFLFESAIFEKRKECALTVEEVKECMLEAQRAAYGDGLDPEVLHPYMWAWKPHYYSAGLSFYNFPYAFGLLFAKGLYAEYMSKGESFTTEYEKLLSITGKNAIADITAAVGIDINNKEFWKNSLKTIEEDIEKFLELSK